MFLRNLRFFLKVKIRSDHLFSTCDSRFEKQAIQIADTSLLSREHRKTDYRRKIEIFCLFAVFNIHEYDLKTIFLGRTAHFFVRFNNLTFCFALLHSVNAKMSEKELRLTRQDEIIDNQLRLRNGTESRSCQPLFLWLPKDRTSTLA